MSQPLSPQDIANAPSVGVDNMQEHLKAFQHDLQQLCVKYGVRVEPRLVTQPNALVAVINIVPVKPDVGKGVAN